jgi:hypothetical protein
MNQALYAHMNNKRKMKKKKEISVFLEFPNSVLHISYFFPQMKK